jgi:hypothetical protein
VVLAGTWLLPSTAGYVHFRFTDYATLTSVGVVIACAAWPVVVGVSRAPRRLYLRLAVVATLALWLPDVILIVRHQPGPAVAVLMVMHLAVALVTYNVVVRVAAPQRASPQRAAPQRAAPQSAADHAEVRPQPATTADSPPATGGAPGAAPVCAGSVPPRLPVLLAVLVGVEFVLGIVTLVVVPIGRPTGLVPASGAVILVVHAVLGLPLAIGALALLVRSGGSSRIERLCGRIGGAGVAIAGVGGLLTVAHPARLLGLALMLAGSATAAFGYLLPTLDRLTDDAPTGAVGTDG